MLLMKQDLRRYMPLLNMVTMGESSLLNSLAFVPF